MPFDSIQSSRRGFLKTLAAGMAIPFVPRLDWVSDDLPFRIRTITAGIELASPEDLDTLHAAIAFLEDARARFVSAGYEVQTIRVATQPLAEYATDWIELNTIERLVPLDRIAEDYQVMLNIGPVVTGDVYEERLPEWSSTLISQTTNTSHTIVVASAEQGVHAASARSAGEAIARIGRDSAGGVGNFRFAATAFSPSETPFFPAAYHRGEPAFGIGLESPRVLTEVISSDRDRATAASRIAEKLDTIIAPIANIAEELSAKSGRRYSGVDTSPAPGLDASIGETIETLTGQPFGSPSTLAACALITDALKSLQTKACGYRGLMLPVLEDRVLARRAIEGRFTVDDILLYSSVCGTGIDVVPLPGDTSAEKLTGLVLDVAALSTKYRKPLSARLFPIPGKEPGEAISFDNPFLTDCVVMSLG